MPIFIAHSEKKILHLNFFFSRSLVVLVIMYVHCLAENSVRRRGWLSLRIERGLGNQTPADLDAPRK